MKLDNTGADGFIPIRSLGTEYFNYDETRHALLGSRSGAMHRLGDVVDVRLVEALPVAGALRFELLSESEFAPTERRREGTKARAAQLRRVSREKGRKQERKKSGKAKGGKSWKA